MSRKLTLLIPLALLAGCHKSAKNDERSASGEVLKGTISDDMLPLDKLKSQGPLLAPSEKKTTPEGVADESSGAEVDVTSADTETSQSEAATPEPAASSAP